MQYDVPSDDIRDDGVQPARGHRRRGEPLRTPCAWSWAATCPSEAVQPESGGQEFVGLLVAVIVLLFAFGSVIAMGLPIGIALVGLATSVGLITLIASFVDVNSVSPTLAAMIGLGVGIDYALFIVTRHRENLQLGMTVEEAAGRAVATSGAAVLFAGITVVIAICGLAIAGIPLVTVMGLMAGLTVAVMVAIALTLLPALLGFAGHKIDAVRLPFMRRRAAAAATRPARESMWHRWGRQVSAHPWRYLVGGRRRPRAAGGAGVQPAPGHDRQRHEPESITTRRAYDLLADGFGPGFNGPLLLSVELDGADGRRRSTPLERAVAADPGVAGGRARPGQRRRHRRGAPRHPDARRPQDEATTTLDPPAPRRRDPRRRWRTGPAPRCTSAGRPRRSSTCPTRSPSRLPWFIGAVIVLSVLLLMMVFRSVAVPLKAAVMNLLSIGAAYGVIVAVFQWGWLKGLVGVEETVPIVSFLPMMLFAILFGLSMDYEVFLLSRVREEYLRRHDNDSRGRRGHLGRPPGSSPRPR